MSFIQMCEMSKNQNVLCSKCEFDAVKNSSLWNVSKTSSQRNWSLILHDYNNLLMILHDYNNLLMIYSGNWRLYFSKETFSPNSCNTDFFKRVIFLRSKEIFVKNSVVQKVTNDGQPAWIVQRNKKNSFFWKQTKKRFKSIKQNRTK